MRYLFIGLLAAASVWGQIGLPPAFRFPEQLVKYLGLTADQMAKIAVQNGTFERWSAERSRRMSQVQLEIGVETARSPLDPAALGVRYAELEAIRREIAEREEQLLPANVAVLTPAQVTKLKVLEEALKLVSTGGEAQSVRLLPCPAFTYPAPFFGSVIPANRVVPMLFPSASCGVTASMRQGDFSGLLP